MALYFAPPELSRVTTNIPAVGYTVSLKRALPNACRLLSVCHTPFRRAVFMPSGLSKALMMPKAGRAGEGELADADV